MQNADQRMVKVDGYELAARMVEPTVRDEPPVVFVNGVGCDATGWSEVAARLRPGPRLVTYDRSNVGASPPRPPHLRVTTYRGYATELAHLLTALGVDEPVVLVGHSMGSLIARLFAATWPDRVAGVVHVDGSVHDVMVRTMDDSYEGTPGPESTVIDHLAGGVELETAEIRPLPSVVLVRSPGRWSTDKIPGLDELWSAGQQRLADELEACRIDAVDSAHWVHTHAPDLVAFAIDAVLTAVRTGETRVRVDPVAVAAVGGTMATVAV